MITFLKLKCAKSIINDVTTLVDDLFYGNLQRSLSLPMYSNGFNVDVSGKRRKTPHSKWFSASRVVVSVGRTAHVNSRSLTTPALICQSVNNLMLLNRRRFLARYPIRKSGHSVGTDVPQTDQRI